MQRLACLTSLFVLLLTAADANTEKAIFRAPSLTTLPAAKPGLDFLRLNTVFSPTPSLRISIPLAFPSETQPNGLDSWYLLRHLNQHQRYELRVCWAATQPTKFEIGVHSLPLVFDTPYLIHSLAAFVERPRDREAHTGPATGALAKHPTHESLLFLHVSAAADFFTTNKTLMSNPPPVDVDIILDPYLASVFPQSLLPTAAYIVVLAIGGWFMSGVIWKRLQPVSLPKKHTD